MNSKIFMLTSVSVCVPHLLYSLCDKHVNRDITMHVDRSTGESPLARLAFDGSASRPAGQEVALDHASDPGMGERTREELLPKEVRQQRRIDAIEGGVELRGVRPEGLQLAFQAGPHIDNGADPAGALDGAPHARNGAGWRATGLEHPQSPPRVLLRPEREIELGRQRGSVTCQRAGGEERS